MSGIRLEIQRPDKPPVVQEMAEGVYPVGSEEGNGIMLPGGGVSPRHAVLSLRRGDCWVEDLASHTGTCLDGERRTGRFPLRSGQRVMIGSYVLIIDDPGNQAPEVAPAVPPPAAEPVAAARPPDPVSGATGSDGRVLDPAPVTPAVPDVQPAAEVADELPDPHGRSRAASRALAHKRSIKKQIHEELLKRLNLKRLTVAGIGEQDLHERARETITAIIAEVGEKLPKGLKPEDVAKEVYDEAVGLGPLEVLLDDEDVTEIMVNGHSRIYVEKGGKLILTDLTFLDNASVLAIIERIVSPLGRRIDESQPYVDARLKDGSRVNAIIHPLSLVGPCLTIRKFSKTPFTDQDLVRFGTFVPLMAEFAEACVKARKNIIISGGTGSGKTSLLNVLSSYLPETDRIVTIEDAAELRLEQDHIVRLEARPPNIEGRGAITIRDLVRNALRMRPDRIVVGECRGGEALDMLQAMNTGHDGSLTTVHANSPRDVISRLETMVLMSGMDLPVRAIREQVAAAIDVIVHESRLSDGTRKVTTISEVVGLEGDRITMQDIFEYVQTGIADDGKVEGFFRPTGSVPTFMEEFERSGISFARTMFDPRSWEEK